ncbi:MAG TPA: citrate synthase/methylcitrate synthase [Ktedonobacterales bacterium]|nr:citrate synthase/methylcitrate synthase [Ktedonobacterales bacterium]
MTAPKGLEGVVVASTQISHVFGEEGRLVYRGYDIGQLAGKATYEEVCHLLWQGHLPTRSELDALNQTMRAQRTLPDDGATLRLLPKNADPMDALRTGVSAVSAMLRISGTPTYEQAIALTARFPTIVAAFHRIRKGLEPLAPRADLGHASNYLYMLTGEVPPENHVKSLDTYLILLADHGMNASTFTARVIASTESDLGSCLTGAIGALKGPLHGGAPALVMDMLDEIGSPENIKPWIDNALDTHKKLMGFGHRVYKTTDPRAEILRDMAQQASPEFYKLAHGTEEYALAELHRRKPDQRLYTNVEFYSASVLHSVGLPRDLYPTTFGVARAAGWSAHVLEQLVGNRLIRPQSAYVGPQGLIFTPIDERDAQRV